jgi:hypothetical protein
MAVGVVLGGSMGWREHQRIWRETLTPWQQIPTAVLAGMYIRQPSLSAIGAEDLNTHSYIVENTPLRISGPITSCERFVAEWSKLRQDNPAEGS